MNKITVLYPVLHYPPVIGGLEQWEQNIAERQDKNIEVIVVTGRVKGMPDFEEKNNVKIFRISPFALKDLSHSSWLYIFSTFLSVFLKSLSILIASSYKDGGSNQYFKEIIIHCHGFISAVMGWILSAYTGKPFIGTEQSLGWARGRSGWLRKLIYKNARICIASSKAVVEEFKTLGIDESKIKVIPNGIDPGKLYPKDQCGLCGVSDVPHKKSKTVLAVGRLEKVKGHKYLLEAFSFIVKKQQFTSAGDGSVLHLVLIGGGSEREGLEKQAKELGIENLVYFAGEVSHDELPHYYHKADIFAMPSFAEGFGISVIEAMACGLPVIVSDVGSLREIVVDKKNGLIVKVGNARELSQAISFLITSVSDAQKLAVEGKKRAADYFWDDIALRVGSLYRGAMQYYE